MSFKDIFKKSFLEGFASTEITTLTVVTALGVACLLALYIFFVYRVVTRKTFYSKNFNITLAGVTVITASLILTMQSSVVLSLGMVGALSIVRFRTAIKEPMDLMFLFWSISVGIICGAGLAQVAVILSVVMTLGILILDRLPVARAPMIFVVNADNFDAEDAVVETVRKYAKHYRIKSRNLAENSLDLVLELRTDEGGRIYLVFPIEKIAAALDRSTMTVKTALSELEDAGLIKRRRSGFSKPNRIYVKMPPDGQKTFQVTDRKPSSIGTENCPTDGQKIVPMMERKLSPNNLSSNNLNQNHLSRESEAPATYGRYENIFLTESEYAELLRDFPDRLDRLISELSSYMESTGRSYQNHAATIRRWAENDKTKGVPKQGIPDYTCKEGESL